MTTATMTRSTAALSRARISTTAPDTAAAGAARAPAANQAVGRPRSPVPGRLLALAAVLGPVVVLAWRTPALSDAFAALRHLDWRWLPLMLLAEVTSKGAHSAAQRHLVRRSGARQTPTLRSMLGITYAANTVSVAVPLAGAQVAGGFTFTQLRRRGVDAGVAGWVLLVSWAAATTAFALLVVLGAVIGGSGRTSVLAAAGGALALLVVAAAGRLLRHPAARLRLQSELVRVATAVLTAASTSIDWLCGRPRRTVRVIIEERVASTIAGPLARLAELRLPARDQAALLLLALVNWLADAACLAVALAAVGAPVPWQGLLLAFTAAAGVTSLGLTPGGVGLVEVALTGALVTAGLDVHQALPAVLLYRLITFWLALGVGGVALAVLARPTRRTPGPATGPQCMPAPMSRLPRDPGTALRPVQLVPDDALAV